MHGRVQQVSWRKNKSVWNWRFSLRKKHFRIGHDWTPCFCVLWLLSDWKCEKHRWTCSGGWWADADQTSDPRDVFYHHHRGGFWVWEAASHTSSRGRWNQPSHQLLSVQCPGSHQSVHTFMNSEYFTQPVCTWLKPLSTFLLSHMSVAHKFVIIELDGNIWH